VSKLKIAVISDVTYPSCLPDDPFCTLYYGSEVMHTTLANALADRGHEVHFYAARGSTPVGIFHPCVLWFGSAPLYDSLKYISLDGSRDEDILQMDGLIDMSASTQVTSELYKDYGFDKYLCYRNGYAAYGVWLSHVPADKRHYVCPSNQNRDMFIQAGYPDTRTIYYGIDDKFYNAGSDDDYWTYFGYRYGITKKEYFLYPHRPTTEKGVDVVLKLAKDFPHETFIITGTAPIADHIQGLNAIKAQKAQDDLKNLIIVDIPMSPKHHYYKRELLRGSKAVLSPYDTSRYYEGFGLANAEAVSCGCPLIISDSPSSRELWTSSEAIHCNSGTYSCFHDAIARFSSFSFDCKNKFKIEDYAANYESVIRDITDNT